MQKKVKVKNNKVSLSEAKINKDSNIYKSEAQLIRQRNKYILYLNFDTK